MLSTQCPPAAGCKGSQSNMARSSGLHGKGGFVKSSSTTSLTTSPFLDPAFFPQDARPSLSGAEAVGSVPTLRTNTAPASFEGGAVTAVMDKAQAWVDGYLSLLADSSTKPGGMEKHLMKLAARAVIDTQKTAAIIDNPLGGLENHVAGIMSQTLIKQLSMAKRADALAAEQKGPLTASPSLTRRVSDSGIPAMPSMPSMGYILEDGDEAGAANSAPGASPPSCRSAGARHLSISGAMAGLPAIQLPSAPRLPPELQSRVEIAGKSAQSKALTMAISCIMTTAVSAVTGSAHMALAHPAAAAAASMPDMSVTVHSASMAQQPGSMAARLMSQVTSAPDLKQQMSDGASGGGALGATGMAASTAMRLLRADSNRSLLGGALDGLLSSSGGSGPPLDLMGSAGGQPLVSPLGGQQTPHAAEWQSEAPHAVAAPQHAALHPLAHVALPSDKAFVGAAQDISYQVLFHESSVKSTTSAQGDSGTADNGGGNSNSNSIRAGGAPRSAMPSAPSPVGTIDVEVAAADAPSYFMFESLDASAVTLADV